MGLPPGHRRSDRHSADLVTRAVVLLIVAVVPLNAYADPGSGLLIWQIAGAFFAGCLYQVRKFLMRLRKKRK
jgi:hypothetical protein